MPERDVILNLHFFAQITGPTVQSTIQLIGQGMNALQAQNLRPTLLLLRISSPGGSSDQGLLMYNFLRQLSIPRKVAIGMGNVDSAAILLFLACDERFSIPNCRYLIHEAKASGQYIDMTYSKLREHLSVMQEINRSYKRVISDRTGKPLTECSRWISRSGVMDVDKAIQRGFVHSEVEASYSPYEEANLAASFTVTTTDPQVTQVPSPQTEALAY